MLNMDLEYTPLFSGIVSIYEKRNMGKNMASYVSNIVNGI